VDAESLPSPTDCPLLLLFENVFSCVVEKKEMPFTFVQAKTVNANSIYNIYGYLLPNEVYETYKVIF
jgi:hypothetical protein